MFQVPPAVIRPSSKAQFHRAAEAMLRMIAADLAVDSSQISIESSAGLTSTMGSVSMETSVLKVEIFMDSFGRNEAPRLVYRDRFNADSIRHKWISDLDQLARSNVILEMRNIARTARPSNQSVSARSVGTLSRLAAWLA